MKNKLKILFEELLRRLTDEKERKKMQYFVVFLIFGVVSSIFTIINIITGYKPLMWSTLIFAVLSFINLGLFLLKKGLEIVAEILFSIEIILLCTFFVIFGEPEGFSAIWCTLLPIGGMLLYRRKFGTIISGVQFLILIFFFWIPFGRSLLQFEYTESFMLRFPLLYLAGFIVGFFFESIRSATQKELMISRDKFKKLSFVDGMTGLANEKAYLVEVNNLKEDIDKGSAKFGVIIVDVNTLKHTNDSCGHDVGTLLLIEIANIITNVFDGCHTFRVGGDEFVTFLEGDNVDKLDDYLKELRYQVTYNELEIKGHKVALSAAVGSSVFKQGDTFLEVFDRADRDMYNNKAKIKSQYHLTKSR